jgi:hypothetical protein
VHRAEYRGISSRLGILCRLAAIHETGLLNPVRDLQGDIIFGNLGAGSLGCRRLVILRAYVMRITLRQL